MSGSGIGRGIRLAAFGVIGIGVLFVAGYLGGKTLAARSSDGEPAASPSSTFTSAPGAEWAPMKEPIPASADCKACHGSENPMKPNIPRMAHPAIGWTNCTSCHTDGGLVQTAPGHSGIHKSACLMCHQPAPENAAVGLPRKHHDDRGTNCLSCHGPTGQAPFPTSMEGRKNCWVCHPQSESERLFGKA